MEASHSAASRRLRAIMWRDLHELAVSCAGRSPAKRGKLEAAFLPSLREHMWVATSGTSRATKIVALSYKALESSALQVNAHVAAQTIDVWINPLPTFHVGGLAVHLRAWLSGSRVVSFPVWHPRDFVWQAESAAATLASVVPTQLHDVVEARLQCPASLRAVVVGGGALEESLHARALELGWPVLRSYGLTEACSQVATEVRPGSSRGSWLPLLDHIEARTDEQGVLELRGPSLLTGWMIPAEDGTARWEDPKRDGWFRTSDRVELRGRQLRVLGRVDDLVKIRGELVDVAALENALQARVASGKVALRCHPDERNGANLTVVAGNAAAGREASAVIDEVFPPYARPSQVVCGTIETTALGKTVRSRSGRGV